MREALRERAAVADPRVVREGLEPVLARERREGALGRGRRSARLVAVGPSARHRLGPAPRAAAAQERRERLRLGKAVEALRASAVVTRSASRLRLPVQDQRDRGRRGAFEERVHQEALAVRRHEVLLSRGGLQGAPHVRREQRNGRADFGRPPVRGQRDRHRHQPIVEPDEEQLPAVGSPAHLRAAVDRDRQLRSRARKRLQVDLGAARLGRSKGDPASIRRELAAPLVELRADDGRGLLAPADRQDPEVGGGLEITLLKEQQAPVARPVGGLSPFRQDESLVGRSVGRLLVEGVRAAAIRAEQDAASVGRPDREDLVRRVRREAAERAALEIEDPDVGVPRHKAMHREAAAVGREARAQGIAGVGLAHRAEPPSRPVEPCELPSLRLSSRAIDDLSGGGHGYGSDRRARDSTHHDLVGHGKRTPQKLAAGRVETVREQRFSPHEEQVSLRGEDRG